MRAILLCLTLQAASPERPGEEGELRNQTFLPTLSPRAEEILRGIEKARERGSATETPFLLRRLFEQLEANPIGAEGALVAVDSRTALGVEPYLWRLFSAAAEKGDYRREAEAQAERELGAAGADEARLRALARFFPASPAAGKAWLRLGDLALERGDAIAASSSYRRAAAAEEAAAEIPPRQAIVSHLLGGADGPEKPKGPRSLRLRWSRPVEAEETGPAIESVPAAGAGGFFFQTRKTLYHFDREGQQHAAIDLDALLFPRDLIFAISGKKEELPPLLRRPVWLRRGESDAEGLLFLVHGDPAAPDFANRVAALRVVRAEGRIQAVPVWQRGWGLEGSGSLSGLTFSPELLIRGGRLYVGAQRVRGEISSFLLCLDARDGGLLWKTFLGKGSPVEEATRRLESAEERDVPGTEPLLWNGTLLYGTNLGVLAALDPADGSYLWSFRYARVPRGKGGWERGRLIGAGGLALLAPKDSDWVYEFGSVPPSPSAADPFLALASAPRRRGSLAALVGSDSAADLFLETGERARRLLGVERGSGRPFASPWLPDGTAAAAASAWEGGGALLVGGRIFLFDRSRELFLAEAVPLAEAASVSEPRILGPPALLPGGLACCVSNRVFFLEER